MYMKESADIATDYNRLAEEWAENTNILRGSIILDHMTPQAGNGKEIELDKIDEYFNNLEGTLIMKNTDVRTGVLNTKQYYDEFVEQSNNFTEELAEQARLMTEFVGVSSPESTSTLLVNTAKTTQKASKRLTDILYKRIEQVDPSVRIDIDFLVDAVDDNKLLKDFVSDEVDITAVDVAAIETAIKSPAKKETSPVF